MQREPSGFEAPQAHGSGKVMLIVCKGGELCPSITQLHLPRPWGSRLSLKLGPKLSIPEDGKLEILENLKEATQAAFPHCRALNCYDSLDSRQQQQQ